MLLSFAWIVVLLHGLARYSLRKQHRVVTINLQEKQYSRVGGSTTSKPLSGIISITASHIRSVCKHAIFNTHFGLANKYFRLLLGIPQGGPLSVVLCMCFCLYREHVFLSSIFDVTKLAPSGAVFRNMFNPSGWAWFCRMVPELTNYPDNLPITAISLNRYVDDVRIVLMMHKHSHVSRLFGIFWLYLYRKFCYGYPCILEDEEYGPTFSFLQGTFGFSSGVLRCNYVARNLPSMLDTGRPKFYNMQHLPSLVHTEPPPDGACFIGW